MKNKIFIFLLVFVLIILSSCSSHSYTYPENYSAEYCFEQYELADPNLAYTECYEFVSRQNLGLATGVNFSAIKGCDDLSYMVYYKKCWAVGSFSLIKIVQKKDNHLNPCTDFTPSNAELIWYNGEWADPEEDAEKYYCYDSQYLSQTVLAFDSKDAITEVMNVAAKETVFLYDAYIKELDETGEYTSGLKEISNATGSLYVKIRFAECDGLVLIGKIAVNENNESYMQHLIYYLNKDKGNIAGIELDKSSWYDGGMESEFYYRLGENMDGLIKQVIEKCD